MTGNAFWLVPAAELLAELHVGREGLTESEAASRLRRDGPNQIEESGQRHLVADLLRRLGNPLIAILLVAAMIATLVALVRGIVSFLQEGHASVRSGEGPSAASLKSNRMMQQRVFFQALAILIVVLILFAGGRT